MAVTREGLINFITEELAVDMRQLPSDAPLFSGGAIDSFALVTLLSYLENEGKFHIDPADVNLENFDSVDRMLNYVARQAG